jgi:hypothetical protein
MNEIDLVSMLNIHLEPCDFLAYLCGESHNQALLPLNALKVGTQVTF